MSQYKNLRRFIYLNVKAQYRGEGYRLASKAVEEERERCAEVAFKEALEHKSGNVKWDANLAENIADTIRRD